MSQIPVPAPITARNLVAALGEPARIVGDEARLISCLTPLEEMCPGALAFSKEFFGALPVKATRPVDAVVIAPAHQEERFGLRDGPDADQGDCAAQVLRPRGTSARRTRYTTHARPSRERHGFPARVTASSE